MVVCFFHGTVANGKRPARFGPGAVTTAVPSLAYQVPVTLVQVNPLDVLPNEVDVIRANESVKVEITQVITPWNLCSRFEISGISTRCKTLGQCR